MGKQITISEEDLIKIISETVKRVLQEEEIVFGKDIDISSIDINTLKSAYTDWRLIPKLTTYGDILSDTSPLNESFGEPMNPDEVVEKIIQRYQLPKRLVGKIEAHHGIGVYVITAIIGINDMLIEEDINKMGYFLGFRGKPQEINGMTYQMLQFEPYSSNQNDVTEEIKSKHDTLYHWTPSYNFENIKRNGLHPLSKNVLFNYPNRIYLMDRSSTEERMNNLGLQLCRRNNNPKNNWIYLLLAVDTKSLDENIRFYYDPNSEMGIYTEQSIPSNCIKIDKTVDFKKFLKKN